MTSTTITRALAAAALAVAASGATPSTAAPAAQARTWWVHRTTTRPIPLHMRITERARHSAGVNEGLILTLRILPKRLGLPRFSDFGIGGVGRDPWVRTYGVDGAPRPDCAAVCDTTNGTGLFDASGEHDRSAIDSEWFVAAYNADIDIEVSKGWRVTPIPNRLDVVTQARTDAVGVRSHNTTVERFTKAAARGGRHGSFAHVVIPCTSAGVGQATLRGGRDYLTDGPLDPLTCTQYMDALGAAVADKPTTWTLAGDVTGWTSWPYRLVVFNLPWVS